MYTSTNKEVLSPHRELSPVTAKDHALGVFHGNEESYSKYLALRTFDRDKHPAWLDALCFRLAELRFEEVPFAKTMGALMYTASIRHLANPVKSWIHQNVLMERPETMREQWFKSIEEIKKVATPRFTDRHYSQIGVPESGVLSQLFEISLSEKAPQDGGDVLQQMKRSARLLMSNERNLEELLGSVISFDPSCNNPFGIAAAKAYYDIGEAIISYSVLSDILEHFDISLTEKKICELYSRLVELPFDHWQNDTVVQALFSYAQALALNPTLSENISRMDIFSRFAMTGRPLSDLVTEVSRLRERKNLVGFTNRERTEITDATETSNLLDQMLHSIEQLFQEWEIDASTEELAPLRLARLAVSQGIPFSKLERLLILHEFDGIKVIEAVRPEGRATTSEQTPTGSQRRPQQLAAGIVPEVTSLSLFVHREGDKEPYTTWYAGLQKSQKHRVDVALKKFAEGHFGNVKKLCTRAKSEADVSAYEVKIKDTGIRIYFRYLPNQRVILLGAGDKHTQERDIPVIMERAALYNGSNNLLSDSLRDWRNSE